MIRLTETDTQTFYRKPEILDEIPLDNHTVIEASAGTGKTFTIEHLYVELLLKKELAPQNILVLTFTEKAAAELQQRVHKILERVVRGGQPTPPPDSPFWSLNGTSRARLEQCLVNFDTAAIHTIHGFFQSVLQQYAFDTDRLFQQEITDSRSAFHEAFVHCLRTQFAKSKKDLEFLAEWLQQDHDPTSLENLLYNCHSQGGDVLPKFCKQTLLTLWRKAPELTGERLDAFRNELRTAGVHGNTVKSITSRLTEVAEILNQCPNWTVAKTLCEIDKVNFNNLREKLPDFVDRLGPSHPVLQWLEAFLKHTVSFEAAIVQQFLPVVRARLEQQKNAAGLFDFDDMIAQVWKALNGERGTVLLKRLRQQYKVALIDEFQDTDDLQWRIFKRIFLDSDRQNLLYVIGDPKQAIYAFRGADVNAYLRARQAIIQAAGSDGLVRLSDNFRSTAELIDAYNLIFDQNAEPPFFDGTINYKSPVRCGAKSYRLADASGHSIAPCVVWQLPGDAEITASDALNPFAREIAYEIDRILNDENQRLWISERTGEARPVEAKDIFILTARNSEGLAVASYLRERRIPHSFYKQEGLFRSPEAEDIRDLLAAVADPRDRSKQYRAWLTPFFAVSLSDLATMGEVPETSDLIRHLSEWHTMAQERKYGALFHSILSKSGIILREIVLGSGERSLTNYQHIFDLLLEEVSQRYYDLEGLVRKLNRLINGQEKPAAENGDVHRLDRERDAVQIMSMHKSKGLEAPVVFLLGGFTQKNRNNDGCRIYDQDGIPVYYIGNDPEIKESVKQENKRENQRLLYVAITRAKFRLYMPYLPEDTKSLNGVYKVVLPRLSAIRDSKEEVARSLFEWRTVQATPTDEAQTDETRTKLASWEPPSELLQPSLPDPRIKDMRWKHRPFTVTSYTHMQKRVKAEQDRESQREEFDRDAPIYGSLVAEDELPGGAQTGTFLHAILEFVDPASFADPFEEWKKRPEIVDLVRRSALRNGIDGRFLESAFRLTYRAMTNPIHLGDTTISGLWQSPNIAREIEFLFPYPQSDHPRLSDPERRAVEIRRGFVKGFVDVVFEYENRIYFLDWKSNVLPSYDFQTIQQEVNKDYDLQLRLYSIAMMKLLEIYDEADYKAKFGGLVYSFLRGLRDRSQAGIYYHRPTWQEVVKFEEDLIATRI